MKAVEDQLGGSGSQVRHRFDLYHVAGLMVPGFLEGRCRKARRDRRLTVIMSSLLHHDDVVGLVRPAIDAHTLGLSSVAQLLRDCGIRTVTADAQVCTAAGRPSVPGNIAVIDHWIRQSRITRLGFSYRLDPSDGAHVFGSLMCQLRDRRLLSDQGGPLQSIFFAGLPSACGLVKQEHGERVTVFWGDETLSETLDRIGIPPALRPREVNEQVAYDIGRFEFGRELLQKELHLRVRPVDWSDCPGFGAKHDLLVNRIRYARERGLLPLIRAHVGPYLPNRKRAVELYLDWCRTLARAGLLDVLSIGTSQLSQSNFGEEWGSEPNGGGVPINSPAEFIAVREASRPMLLRTYAGTNRMPELARMYEETINIAWHAFSLWWFCAMDGRGPLSVRENLRMQLETLRVVADSGKPYEPNTSHHFAFRGADDVTFIVSAVLAARVAKRAGVRHLVLQNMLNTPRYTWGVQDLAKSRALLTLVRELEDERFKVLLQPRAGLDFFSHDPEKSKIQLAAVTALMDDIEPHDPASPCIIHVVSYSEGSHLAEPHVVNESIQITRAALMEYRRQRDLGLVEDMSRNPDVLSRTEELLSDARTVLGVIERHIHQPYSAQGLYNILAGGFLPIPYLWECRGEFQRAVGWRSRVFKGSVRIIDDDGRPISVQQRMDRTVELLHRDHRVSGHPE